MSLDPRALGLFRILLACLLLLDLGLRAACAAPLELAFVSVGPVAAHLLCALFALVYASLLLGYHTRASQLAALLAHTCLALPFSPLRPGGDFALQVLLASSALLPLGLCFSLDALSVSWKARVEHVAAELQLAARPGRVESKVVTIAPLLALAAWLLVPLQLSAGAAFLSLGTWHWTLPLLVALVLLRPPALDALGRALARGRPHLICFFDSDCGICFQFARLLARLDVFERIELRSNQGHESLPAGVGPELVEHTIVAFDRDRARTYLRSEAIARLCLALPGGGLPFLVLRTPGLRALFERLYDVVARNRREISVALGFAACGVPSKRTEPSAASEAAAAQARATTSARASFVLRELTLALLVLSVSWSALSSPPTHRSDSAAGREPAPDSARDRSR